jgi:hypothetical protein
MHKHLLLALALGTLFHAGAQNSNANNNAYNDRWRIDGNVADSTHFFGTTNDMPVKFRSNNVERLLISPEGYLGIGTSDPQSLLDVNGDATFRNQVYMNGLAPASPGNLVLFLDPATGQLRAGESGNVPYPPAPGTPCDPMAIVQNPVWHNGPNKIFTSCPQIYVGIGTVSPEYHLDVRGNSKITGALGIGTNPILNNVQVNVKTQANRGVGICIDHDVFDQFSYGYKINVYDETTKGFAIFSNLYNKEVFAMRADGQLTISNDQQKILQLEPNGLLRSRHIKVDLDNWADYVFDEGYPLMPLNEVENFIEANGHLPNVPSAEEMIENGLDVEETNRMLMEKVEELTLYLIEQHKEIDALKAEIDTLKLTKP